MTTPEQGHLQPGAPEDFAWLIDDFVGETAGVSDALIVSADGLLLVASLGLSSDLADPLSAMVAGLISLCGNIADHLDRGTCEHIMLRLTHGHLLFMSIGPLAGLAVLTDATADLGTVARQMNRLVSRTGHVLTPKLRDDLRRHSSRRRS